MWRSLVVILLTFSLAGNVHSWWGRRGRRLSKGHIVNKGLVGCYKDTSRRVLGVGLMTSSSMTVIGCMRRCLRENTKYFGVENGNQCFCGSVMRFKIKKPKKDCKRKCTGSRKACGGRWRILVYRNPFYRRCRVTKATTCEGHSLTLRCRRGTVIRVVYAIYGRRNRRVCAPKKSIKTTKCRARNSTKIAVKTCDGKRTCRLKANNGVFGDPCIGTYKYLSVNYSCRKPCVKNAYFNGRSCKCKTGYRGYGFRKCTKRKTRWIL